MTPRPLSFADRRPSPSGNGQALQLPDNARQCGRVELEVIRWPETARPVMAGTSTPPADVATSRATTNRPTIVIDGVAHPLVPGWSWPARAHRTEQ